MDFLTNTWFVGIIGGIISGIVVFFITNIITNKLYKKDYYKTVRDINFKISGLLIMSIAEGKIPNPKVVGAILNSLARRNNVRKQDVNNIEDTYDDLINELFETNFIPIDKKQILAIELLNLKEEYLNEKQVETVPAKQQEFTKVSSISKGIFLSISVVIIALYITLITYYFAERNLLLDKTEPLLQLIMISLMSFSVATVALTLSSIKRQREKRNNALRDIENNYRRIIDESELK